MPSFYIRSIVGGGGRLDGGEKELQNYFTNVVYRTHSHAIFLHRAVRLQWATFISTNATYLGTETGRQTRVCVWGGGIIVQQRDVRVIGSFIHPLLIVVGKCTHLINV